MKLRLTQQAQDDIEQIESYWSQHRSQNPNLFREEIHEAFTLIEESPRSAPMHEEDGFAYHRLILPRTRHWVLYEYHEKASLVVIMTVWSPRRGDKPRLPEQG